MSEDRERQLFEAWERAWRRGNVHAYVDFEAFAEVVLDFSGLENTPTNRAMLQAGDERLSLMAGGGADMTYFIAVIPPSPLFAVDTHFIIEHVDANARILFIVVSDDVEQRMARPQK